MRTRDDAAYGQRSAGARPSADDPLAELARLIGQEDPFAEFFRENADAGGQPAPAAPAARSARPAAPAPRPAHAEPPRSEPVRQEPQARQQPPVRQEPVRQEPVRHESSRPAPGPFSALAAEVYAEPVPRQSEPRGRSEPRDHQEPPRPASRPVREPEAPRAIERNPRVSDRAEAAVAEALFATPAPSAQAQPTRAPTARTQPAAPARDANFRDATTSRAAPASLPGFDAPAGVAAARPTARTEPQSRGGYTLDDDAYDYGRTAVERDGYESEASGEADDGYEYEAYEEERPPRSRRLALLGTAIGCAILLIAGGYFGLRAMSGGGGTLVASGQPPVIKADHGPNKVAPPQQAGGDQSADGQKLIYDRVGGDPSGNERVVSSQEEPVDPSQAAQPQAQPRVILPPTGGSGPAPSPSTPAPLGAMPSASPPQAQQPSSSGSANPTEPKRVRTLTVRADGTVVDGSSAPVLQAPSASLSPAQAPVGAPMQVSSYAQDDASSSMPANVPLPPTRVAAAPVASPTTAAPAAPAATDAAGSNGYFVQVAAQRTQGEAQSAWRATQGKYPGILGSYSANIRRADLGDRGIYYRAQVGPFNSKDQANELCQSLRAQGGDCMVQRN